MSKQTIDDYYLYFLFEITNLNIFQHNSKRFICAFHNNEPFQFADAVHKLVTIHNHAFVLHLFSDKQRTAFVLCCNAVRIIHKNMAVAKWLVVRKWMERTLNKTNNWGNNKISNIQTFNGRHRQPWGLPLHTFRTGNVLGTLTQWTYPTHTKKKERKKENHVQNWVLGCQETVFGK